MPPQVIDAAFGEVELSSELLNLPISLRATKFGQWNLSVERGMQDELHLSSSLRTILNTLGAFLQMRAALRLCVPPYTPTIPTPTEVLCKHQHSQAAASVPVSRHHCCAAFRAAASAPPSIDAGASPVGHVRKSPCELSGRRRAPSDVATLEIFRQTTRCIRMRGCVRCGMLDKDLLGMRREICLGLLKTTDLCLQVLFLPLQSRQHCLQFIHL